MSGTQTPYSNMNGNGTTPHKMRTSSSLMRLNPVPVTCAQHDDLIKYVHEAWDKVSRELNAPRNAATGTVAYYQEREPNPRLRDFKAFDLEGFWGKRIVQNFQAQNQHNAS